ncbi:hypothetical protein BH23GEM11_BH23GEM11_17240 [soil metagenome]
MENPRELQPVRDHFIPILLGGGVPLLPPPAAHRRLRLVGSRSYPGGMVLREYDVEKGPGEA